LNESFEQYINGKRENLHSNFTLRLKKILWEARSTPTLVPAILKLADHTLFKIVKYVLDPVTSEAGAKWPRRGCVFPRRCVSNFHMNGHMYKAGRRILSFWGV
jgi:hypothetical protein